MSWTDFAAIGDVIAALAVVVSLIYVGRQIRQSNRIARAEAYREIAGAIQTAYANWSADDETVGLAVRIYYDNADREQFTPFERMKFGLRLTEALRTYQTLFTQVQEGILPIGAEGLMPKQLYRTRYVQTTWPYIKDDFDPAFCAFFENLYISEQRLASPARQ